MTFCDGQQCAEFMGNKWLHGSQANGIILLFQHIILVLKAVASYHHILEK